MGSRAPADHSSSTPNGTNLARRSAIVRPHSGSISQSRSQGLVCFLRGFEPCDAYALVIALVSSRFTSAEWIHQRSDYIPLVPSTYITDRLRIITTSTTSSSNLSAPPSWPLIVNTALFLVLPAYSNTPYYAVRYCLPSTSIHQPWPFTSKERLY